MALLASHRLRERTRTGILRHKVMMQLRHKVISFTPMAPTECQNLQAFHLGGYPSGLPRYRDKALSWSIRLRCANAIYTNLRSVVPILYDRFWSVTDFSSLRFVYQTAGWYYNSYGK